MTSLNRLMILTAAVALLTNSRATAAQQVNGAAILPGDVIRLQIWRETDLSGDFVVDEEGTVTFPKLGPLQVAAENASSLKSRLVEAYQQYLRNPSIQVIHLRRINVLGAVKAPGLYPVDPTMRIADAIALAGGATPDGDRTRVELIRDGKRQSVSLTDVDRIADLPLRSGDQLFVPERRWISRNPGVLAASLSAAVSLVIAVFLR